MSKGTEAKADDDPEAEGWEPDWRLLPVSGWASS